MQNTWNIYIMLCKLSTYYKSLLLRFEKIEENPIWYSSKEADWFPIKSLIWYAGAEFLFFQGEISILDY